MPCFKSILSILAAFLVGATSLAGCPVEDRFYSYISLEIIFPGHFGDAKLEEIFMSLFNDMASQTCDYDFRSVATTEVTESEASFDGTDTMSLLINLKVLANYKGVSGLPLVEPMAIDSIPTLFGPQTFRREYDSSGICGCDLSGKEPTGVDLEAFRAAYEKLINDKLNSRNITVTNVAEFAVSSA